MKLPKNITLENDSRSDVVKILDRYVFNELLSPFLFGMAMFTVLFMATGPIFDMANLVIAYGIPVRVVLEYALVRLPSFISFTVPMSVLLATLVAFGRLSMDHEMVALKGGGMSFFRIVVPALIFALLATALSYFLVTKLAPESLYMAKLIVAKNQNKHQFFPLQDIKFTSTTEDGLERITIAKSFDETTGVMQSPVINDYGKNGEIVRITHAQQAVWKNNTWTLDDGEIFQFDSKGDFQSRMTFQNASFNLSHSPGQISLVERSPDEMVSSQLRKTIAIMERDPMKDKDQIRSLWMRYRLRQALPFACVVFALVGAPSGIRPVRSTSSSGVAMSVFIVLIYYFFVAIGNSLGEHGAVSPVIASWFPNVFFFGLAIFFLLKEAT